MVRHNVYKVLITNIRKNCASSPLLNSLNELVIFFHLSHAIPFSNKLLIWSMDVGGIIGD